MREERGSSRGVRPRAVRCGATASSYVSRVQIARVIGRVVSTVKQDTLAAVTLQWIQPITTAGQNAGKPIVAVDRVGVGPGEIIYFITSREAALTLDNPFAAVDAGIVGKVDWVDVEGRRVLLADDVSADPSPTSGADRTAS
jgi:ethanolamine utilization protein EutN